MLDTICLADLSGSIDKQGISSISLVEIFEFFRYLSGNHRFSPLADELYQSFRQNVNVERLSHVKMLST